MTDRSDPGVGPDLAGVRRATQAAIARGVAAGWIHVFVVAAAGPVQTYFLLRYLTAAEAGYWLVVLSFTSYLALFDLGIGPTLTRSIAFLCGAPADDGLASRLEAQSPWQSALSDTIRAPVADLIATAHRLYLLLSGALVVTAIALGPTLLPHIAKRAFVGSAAYVWVLLALGSAANLLGTVNYATLAGLGIVGVNRLARAGAQLLGLTLSILALQTGYGVAGVAASWVAQNVLFLAAGAVFLRRLYPELQFNPGSSRRALARAMIGPSLRWAGIGLGAAMIFAIGPAVVSSYLGPASVPEYVVLFQLVNALYVLSVIPAQASEPFVARAYSAGERNNVVGLLMRNLRHMALPLICGSAFLAAFGGEVVALWVGAASFAGYPSLWLLILLFVLEAHHVAHASVVMATGRVIFLPAAIAAGLLTVSFAVALVPRLGVLGMALSMVAAQLLTNNWYAPWCSMRLLQVAPRWYFRTLTPVGVFALGTVGVALSCKGVLLAVGARDIRVVVAIGVAVTSLVGLALAWYLVLEPKERQFLTTVVERMRGAHVGR